MHLFDLFWDLINGHIAHEQDGFTALMMNASGTRLIAQCVFHIESSGFNSWLIRWTRLPKIYSVLLLRTQVQEVQIHKMEEKILMQQWMNYPFWGLCFLEMHCLKCPQVPWSYMAHASTAPTALSCSVGYSPSSTHA